MKQAVLESSLSGRYFLSLATVLLFRLRPRHGSLLASYLDLQGFVGIPSLRLSVTVSWLFISLYANTSSGTHLHFDFFSWILRDIQIGETLRLKLFAFGNPFSPASTSKPPHPKASRRRG